MPLLKKTQICNTHLCKDTNYINSVHVAIARPDPEVPNQLFNCYFKALI